jgi:hypothetical protein
MKRIIALVAGAIAMGGAARHATNNAGHYTVRCLELSESERMLNRLYADSAWRLLSMAPHTCSVDVAGQRQNRDGIVVVLEH